MAGQRHFFSDALRREQIDGLELVLAILKVLHIDPALARQGFEAIVQAAHAHTQLISQFALGEVWVFLQDAHHPEISVFLNLGLSTGHGVTL